MSCLSVYLGVEGCGGEEGELSVYLGVEGRVVVEKRVSCLSVLVWRGGLWWRRG